MPQYIVTFITGLTSIVLARLLSIEDRGELATFVLIFSWFYTSVSLLHPATLQYNNYRLDQYLFKYTNYLKFSSVIVIVIVIVAFLILDKKNIIFIVIPYYIVYYLNELIQNAMYRHGHLRLYWKNQIYYQLSNLCLMLIVLWYFPNTQVAVMVLVLSQLFFLILNGFSIVEIANPDIHKFLHNTPKLSNAICDIKENFHNYIYHFAKGLITSGDKLIIVYFFTVSQFGVYTVLLIFYSLIAPFAQYVIVTNTAAVKSLESSKGVFHIIKGRKFLMNLFIFVTATIIIFFHSEFIIKLFFSEKYINYDYLSKYIVVFAFASVLYHVIVEYILLTIGTKPIFAVQIFYISIFFLSIVLLSYISDSQMKIEWIPLIQILIYIASILYLIMIKIYHSRDINKS